MQCAGVMRQQVYVMSSSSERKARRRAQARESAARARVRVREECAQMRVRPRAYY